MQILLFGFCTGHPRFVTFQLFQYLVKMGHMIAIRSLNITPTIVTPSIVETISVETIIVQPISGGAGVLGLPTSRDNANISLAPPALRIGEATRRHNKNRRGDTAE